MKKTPHPNPVYRTFPYLKPFFSKESILFLLLCGIVVFLFKRAFQVPFVLDDFFFLTIGKAQNVGDFLNFFSPFKGFFYRPLTTETFFFIINNTKQNIFFAHTLSFISYFIGLFFLFRVSFLVTQKKLFSLLFVFLYAITFTHVFQLYMFNTYQEVAMFMFLTISSFFFLKNRYIISCIFFIAALMSKESALVFPGLLFIYIFYQNKLHNKKQYFIPLLFTLIAVIFFFIYQHGASKVEQIDIYTIHLDPRLILNNFLWYLLWSLGLPNFYPNYTSSIFAIPTADFWNLLHYQDYKIYFYSFLSFYSLLGVSLLFLFIKSPKMIKLSIKIAVLMLLCFFLFISPTLPIIHRWMVRLTVPQIFIAAMQAYLIYQLYISGKILRTLSVILIALFIILQYVAINIHESSSLIFLEAEIANHTKVSIQQNQKAILDSGTIYFLDTKESPFGGSKKLKLSLHNQDFLNYYLPNKKVKAVYGIDQAIPPKGAFILQSTKIINGN